MSPCRTTVECQRPQHRIERIGLGAQLVAVALDRSRNIVRHSNQVATESERRAGARIKITELNIVRRPVTVNGLVLQITGDNRIGDGETRIHVSPKYAASTTG